MPKELVKTIKIVEEIYGWGYTFKDIVTQTRLFDGNKLIVPVNSYGGSVTEGMAIYNYLLGLGIEVEVRIVGYAMSMGTIICCAASKVVMPENSWFMIHNPTMGKYGDKDDLAGGAELLRKMTNDLAEIYNKKTGIEIVKILEMMKKETWLTGKEALELGFVDELSKGVSLAAASADKEFFNKLHNVPASIAKEVGANNSQNENLTKMEKLFAKLTAFFGREINANTTPEQLDDAISTFNAAQSDKISNVEQELKTIKAKINADLTETVKSSLGDIVKNQVESSIAAFKADITDVVKNQVTTEVKATSDRMEEISKVVNDLKSHRSGNNNGNHSNDGMPKGTGSKSENENVDLGNEGPLSKLANFKIEIV